MSAYLIDPENASISKLPIEAGDYDAIRKAIGCHFLALAANLPNHDTVFVNENNCLESGPRYFFRLEGSLRRVEGRAVVVGSDHVGECSNAKTNRADLIPMVIWTK